LPLNHISPHAQLTDRQFELLGRAMVEWSNLEFLLGRLLSRLLHTPDFLSRIYTDQLNAARIEIAIREAVELQHARYDSAVVSPVIQAEILSVVAKVHGMRSLRNKIAHFCWSRSNDDEIFGTSFSGGLPGSAKHDRSFILLTTTELEAAYQAFSNLVDELQRIVLSLPELTEEQALAILRREKNN
jgi:hypothetical protein